MWSKILYHGSTVIVEKPNLSKFRNANDFGKCFYCTENINLAKEWACQKGETGIVSMYEINLEGLSIINLNSEQYHILNWVGTILKYRSPNNLDDDSSYIRDYLIKNFAVNLSRADIIVGYRADDSYFQYMVDFLRNGLSLERLSEAMHLGKLGEQVAVHSEKSIHQLIFKQYFIVEGEYSSRYITRDLKAREEYLRMRRGQIFQKNKLTAERIVQEEMKNDDPRLLAPLYRGRTRKSWQHV